MKKIMALLVLIIMVFLVSCIEQEHEECIETWDEHMETRYVLFVGYTAYVLETEYGNVTVSKKIYEASIAGEYSKICLLVLKGEETKLKGAILIDGTPLDQDLIDEIADQVIPDELLEEDTE